ncbi:MAG: hypothetical protein IT294_13935 [Deltaproteobacteria bacterium]|nr:hypothetical protein [Deltaproteobacteria bacterium]
MSARPHQPPAPDASTGHEESDVAPASIGLSVLGLGAIAVAAFVAMLVLFNVLARLQAAQTSPPNPLAARYGLKEPPAPRLQTDPRQDLVDLHAREAAAIRAYGWVDKQAGVVRVPVERAIALLAERGLPARPAAPKDVP